MGRFMRSTLVLILFGLFVGLTLGGVIGFYLLPVNFINTDVVNFRSAQKDDYVLMVSAAYALDGNLNDAKQRLVRLDPDPNAAVIYVTDVAQRAIQKHDTRNSKNVAALAVALGAAAPVLRDFVQTPTPAGPTPGR